jgi:LysM repeat protein
MQSSTSQAVKSILFGALSIIIAVGSVSLSLAENNNIVKPPAPTAAPSNTQAILPTQAITPSSSNETPIVIPTEIASLTATATLPAPTSCPLPSGWVTTSVKNGDTAQSIAMRYNISVQLFLQQNCLLIENLTPNSIIYVPYIAPITATPCRPPAGWIQYIVQPGDTLYHLAWAYNINVTDLQNGNCMGASQFLAAFQILYVPNVITRTPSLTITPIPTNTATATTTPTTTQTLEPTTTEPQPSPTETPSPTATQ